MAFFKEFFWIAVFFLNNGGQILDFFMALRFFLLNLKIGIKKEMGWKGSFAKRQIV